MCNCIELVNKELAERNANTEIHVPFTMSRITRVCVETEKIDDKKRGKPMKVFASFCPFCGKEYAAQQSVHPTVAPVAPPEVESTTRNSG